MTASVRFGHDGGARSPGCRPRRWSSGRGAVGLGAGSGQRIAPTPHPVHGRRLARRRRGGDHRRRAAGAQVVTAGASQLDCRDAGDGLGRERSRMNLSAWALRHRSLTLFLILAVAAAGVWAYLSLGRGEDPPFTIKQMVVQVDWPGASAEQMARSVIDRIERKLEELPSLDYVDSTVQPGHAIMIVSLRDDTPPAEVPGCGTRCARKSATSRRRCRRACRGRTSTTSSATSSASSMPSPATVLPAAAAPCRRGRAGEPAGRSRRRQDRP